MCIIIDTNTAPKVFKSTDHFHADFEPVLEWITSGNGKIILGGTKFDSELTSRMTWFRRILVLLDSINKVAWINNQKVDKIESEIRALEPNPDFDDPHLIALIIASKTKLVCTQDKRAIPYINRREFYPKHCKTPSIYTSKKNRDLLRDENICKCCQPKESLSKKQSKALAMQLNTLV